jgi:hypothetical protein
MLLRSSEVIGEGVSSVCMLRNSMLLNGSLGKLERSEKLTRNQSSKRRLGEDDAFIKISTSSSTHVIVVGAYLCLRPRSPRYCTRAF